jgi:hypothetical protein
MWLIGDDTDDLSRPDRSHYVIDVVPDYIIAINGEDLKKERVTTIQIWCDPKHPDAHRDPKLREYLMRRSIKERIIGQVRYANDSCLVLIPPNLTEDGQWIEKEGVLG